jgi:glycosyltransferase involved in cell wall biosynthesis
VNDREPLPQVLIVDFSYRYGGASARVISQVARMPEGRVALAGLEAGAVTRRGRELGLLVHSAGFHKADPRIIAWLAEVIRQGNYQVVDAQNVQSKLWGSLAAARTGAALVSTINSWYTSEHGPGLKGRFYQAVELMTNRNLDLYIAVSGEVKQNLLAAGIVQDRIVLIPNAVAIDPDAVPDIKARLCQQLGLPGRALICCAAGRLVWAKGYDDLIAGFSMIADRHPDLHCLILGEGRLRPDLEDQIGRVGLRGRIHLMGFREPGEALAILKASDVFVMPSRSEGTPVALLETAALGIPILATRVGGIPELVKDGKQAILVPPGDPDALSAGITRLIEDSDLAARLGSQAQERVRREYSLQAQFDATLQAYRLAWAHRLERLGQGMSRIDPSATRGS